MYSECKLNLVGNPEYSWFGNRSFKYILFDTSNTSAILHVVLCFRSTIALLALMFCCLLARNESATSSSAAESDPHSSGGDGRATAVSSSSNLTCLILFARLAFPALFTPLFFVPFSSSSASSSSSVGCWVEGVERRATLSLKVCAPEDGLDVAFCFLGERSGWASSSSSSSNFEF